MPNGHGGIPKYGSVIFLLILIAPAIYYWVQTNNFFAGTMIPPLFILFGWKLAWHQYMYDVMEYGGGYTSEEEMETAKTCHKKALFLYIAGAIVVGVAILMI